MSGFLAVLSAIWWFISFPFREQDWIDVPLYEDVDDSTLECADVSAIRSLARGLAWCMAGLLTPFPTKAPPPLELYEEVDDFTLEGADVAPIRALARALSCCFLALFALPPTSASGPLPSSMAASTQTGPPALTFTGIIPSSVISISPSVPAKPAKPILTGPLPSSMAANLTITGLIHSSIVSISPAAPSKPVRTGQVPSSMAPTLFTPHRPTTIPGPVPSSMVPKSSTIPRLTTPSGPGPSSLGSIHEAAAAPSRNYKRGLQFHFANPPPPARPNIPVPPPPSAPSFQFGSNVSPLPAVPPPSRLNSAGFSFGMGFMADAAETSRALNARAAATAPAIVAEEKGEKPEEIVKVEKEPELEKEEEDTGVEVESKDNSPRESRQAKRAREKREKKEKKKEEKGKTPPRGPSAREVLEGGA